MCLTSLPQNISSVVRLVTPVAFNAHLPQPRLRRPQSRLGWDIDRGPRRTKGQNLRYRCHSHPPYCLRTGRGWSEGSGSCLPTTGPVRRLVPRRCVMGTCSDAARWERHSCWDRRRQCGLTTQQRRAPRLARRCLQMKHSNSNKSKSAVLKNMHEHAIYLQLDKL